MVAPAFGIPYRNERDPQQFVDDIARKAQIDSDVKERIENNVRAYMSDSNFDRNAYTQDLQKRCMSSPRVISIEKKKKTIKTVLVTAGVLLALTAFGLAWKYAWNTSPLYGQQHNPAITQSEGGTSFGK